MRHPQYIAKRKYALGNPVITHLVFTDAEMPGTMDGIELAHYIRNRWPPVKLIVVSGEVAIDTKELPAGARFFPKPYRETSIVDAMIGMLSGAP